MALVSAADAAGRCAAIGAGRRGRPRLYDDGDTLRGGQDLDNGQTGRKQGQQTSGQGKPSTQEQCFPHVLTQPWKRRPSARNVWENQYLGVTLLASPEKLEGATPKVSATTFTANRAAVAKACAVATFLGFDLLQGFL